LGKRPSRWDVAAKRFASKLAFIGTRETDGGLGIARLAMMLTMTA
jgi:hypothetical protein